MEGEPRTRPRREKARRDFVSRTLSLGLKELAKRRNEFQ